MLYLLEVNCIRTDDRLPMVEYGSTRWVRVGHPCKNVVDGVSVVGVNATNLEASFTNNVHNEAFKCVLIPICSRQIYNFHQTVLNDVN